MKSILGPLFVTALTASGCLAATHYLEKPGLTALVKVEQKVHELPELGVNRPRPNGGWINVQAQGIRLIVRFYDADKKPVPSDMQRGFIRLRYASKKPGHTVLTREGDTLATPATIRPPHNYLVILSLFAGDGGENTETHTFTYP